MLDLSIAQAVIEGETILARSANFNDDWQASAISMCKGFGPLPPGASCPAAIFARPLGRKWVAITQVGGPPAFTSLRFRFLVLSRTLYDLLNDPFAIADRFPPNWDARGVLPDLEWPSQPLPRRTMAQLDAILKQGDGPFLLGASQALVDGGKILLQRETPDPGLLRDLRLLLPDSTRRDVWPATFAYSNDLGFDLIALPAVPENGVPGYLSEDQARDYPESRYERNLQEAIESGDQRTLDRLLSRRSSTETLRLALFIIAVGVGTVIVGRLLVTLGVI